MRITVAVCTWNRARLLAQTLDGLAQLSLPPGLDWDVVVVNNNCTDNTDEVIASFADRLPLVRCWEPTPGASPARNCAVRHATGDYIVWTDDDVRVDEDWLAAYCRAFERWPDAAVFGGPINPWFEEEPPDWLRQVLPKIAGAFGHLDLGPEPLPLREPDRIPYGGNMAVRTAEQRAHAFNAELGPRHGVRVNGEETAVLRAILASGGSGRWVPEARVRHFVPRARQTVQFLRQYYRGYGREFALQVEDRPVPTWLGRPRWAWRHTFVGELRYRLTRWLARPQRWMLDLIDADIAWGILDGYAMKSRRVASPCGECQ